MTGAAANAICTAIKKAVKINAAVFLPFFIAVHSLRILYIIIINHMRECYNLRLFEGFLHKKGYFSAPQTRDASHPSLLVVRGASRLVHLEKMSKICSVSQLPVQISLIFSGVLNNYKKDCCGSHSSLSYHLKPETAYTSSRRTSIAASPFLWPILTILVYPPFLSAYFGPYSSKSLAARSTFLVSLFFAPTSVTP